ncbi:MAG TPA: hypothetical protein VLJ17_24660 [Xanthobacteraceae bacterium]|nr:hypothetical protein [Xanthobacteraceae bacterium]
MLVKFINSSSETVWINPLHVRIVIECKHGTEVVWGEGEDSFTTIVFETAEVTVERLNYALARM